MASFIIDDHFGSTLKRSDYLDGPELCTVCAQLHILHVWVQHQFQMTPETQTQSPVVHTCSLLIQTVEIPTRNHKGKKCEYLQPTPAQPSSITNILCTVTP